MNKWALLTKLRNIVEELDSETKTEKEVIDLLYTIMKMIEETW